MLSWNEAAQAIESMLAPMDPHAAERFLQEMEEKFRRLGELETLRVIRRFRAERHSSPTSLTASAKPEPLVETKAPASNVIPFRPSSR